MDKKTVIMNYINGKPQYANLEKFITGNITIETLLKDKELIKRLGSLADSDTETQKEFFNRLRDIHRKQTITPTYKGLSKNKQNIQNSHYLLPFYTYEILLKNSSFSNPLSYSDIKELLEKEKNYKLTSSYQKNFQELFAAFELVGLPVIQVNRKYYLKNKIDGGTLSPYELCQLADNLNRYRSKEQTVQRLLFERMTYAFSNKIEDFRTEVLYSRPNLEEHPIIKMSLIPKIKQAIKEKNNLIIKFDYNRYPYGKSVAVSPYYFTVCDNRYYLMGIEVGNKPKKLSVFPLEGVNEISKSKTKFIDFDKTCNLDELKRDLEMYSPSDKLVFPNVTSIQKLVDNLEVYEEHGIPVDETSIGICEKVLKSETIGYDIKVEFYFDVEHISIADIIYEFGGHIGYYCENYVRCDYIPKNIFLNWAVLNFEYITIIDNDEIIYEIREKIDRLSKAKNINNRNQDANKIIELYINIHSESCKEYVQKKFGKIDIGIDNKTTIQCRAIDKQKFFEYAINNIDKITINNFNKYCKTSDDTKAAYNSFLRLLKTKHTCINTLYEKYKSEINHIDKK